VGLGAIVVVGAELRSFSSAAPQGSAEESLFAEPLPCIEILGRSMMERTIERFVRAGVEVVSVLVSAEVSYAVQPLSTALRNIDLEVVADVGSAVIQKFDQYLRDGIEHTFVMSASIYTETDLLDMFYFHREGRRSATRAFDSEVPLDLWVVDCAKGQQYNLDNLLEEAQGAGSSYFIREYVSRLSHPRDLRRLVSDALRGGCGIRPSGTEVKPGIWVGEGAEVHRRARIVAPAYVGGGSKVKEDTLITRFSSIERGCYVDYGTVVEDSSILANTHIGIWLDVCHSVARESKLFNLEHNVILEISDPSIMRATNAVREGTRNVFGVSHGSRPTVADLQAEQEEETPAPKGWQLGANPIQG
jgi:NDP-sugar pyrophosphorylase family protein